MGWFSQAFESVLGVGAVDQQTPAEVLERLPVDSEFSAAEAAELRDLARSDPGLLVDVLAERGKPKRAAAIRSSLDADQARDARHADNVRQTAEDIGRDARDAGRKGTNWIVVGGIVAAVVLLTQSDR